MNQLGQSISKYFRGGNNLLNESPVIRVDDNWDIANQELITGTIYLQYGNNVFPYFDWNDYPLNILEGWIDITVSNFMKRVTYYLFFLDGPYCIRVNRITKNHKWYYQLNMITNIRTYDERILWSCDVRTILWLNELLSAANNCLKTAEVKGIDCSKLKKQSKRIMKYVRYLRTFGV